MLDFEFIKIYRNSTKRFNEQVKKTKKFDYNFIFNYQSMNGKICDRKIYSQNQVLAKVGGYTFCLHLHRRLFIC
ncbi:hypothetical protein [Lachnoanaerobaculum sp. OBRC5-5]|uniref:hypothetical protein n=1 Tax=Lachnoanaerobaculum sp. OBRC5-5 TaxID=936595 RepID=UPI0026F3C072|nr:hypothetical protein [Lachnoanaerobaculum sp. OBRC5-5]